MKKLLLFFCSTAFLGAIAQNSNHAHNHQHPTNPHAPIKNEASVLKGFDAAAAMRIAKARSTKPAEQQEVFESLKRRYLAEHSGVTARGTSNYSYNFDPASKTGFINLTPTPMNGNCPNAGFENIDFSNWQGGTYTNTGAQNWGSFTPTWTNGIVTLGNNTYPQAFDPAFSSPYQNRHTIMTIPPTVNNPPTSYIGWDSIAINSTTHLSDIEFVPPTANGVTARLGNANNNYNETERLVYSMTVSPSNSQFTFSYAVIIFDGGHAVGEQPFFKITTRDQAGNPIAGCGQYQIDATQVSTDPSFFAASYWASWSNSWVDPTPGGFNSYYYKKWTTVGIDLTAYIGQTVSFEFQTGDCIFGGHWAYAYIDASCQPAQATVNMCTGSTTAVLVAPPGYNQYQWYGPNGMTLISGANNDSLNIANAVVGDVYTVALINAAGCTTSMQTTLTNTNITIQNTLSTPSCATGTSGTASVIPQGSNNGYNFSWTNVGTGATVPGNVGNQTGLSPGTYSVVISSPGCGSADTTITVGIAPPIFYTDLQNFCLTPANVVAPAGSNYVWYDPSGNIIPGATTGSLSVATPVSGTSYTTVFMTPSGCRDSVKITLTQTVNIITQNTTFCGTTANLSAPAGATNVNWYDANWPYTLIGTGSTISIASPIASPWQPYWCSYTNPTTGCLDSMSIYLTNTPSAMYASNIVPTCEGLCTGSATLNLISGAAVPFNLTVSGPNGYTFANAAATATENLTGLCAGNYSASFTDGQCTATATFAIDTIEINVTTAVAPDTICSGQTATVTFTYGGATPTSCGAATSGCANPSIVQVGNGVAQNFNTSWPSVYGNWFSNEKYQILYSAADLLAAGVVPGKLSSIAFDVASIPAGMNQTFINYTIKIGCTSVADLDPTGLAWNVPFQTGVNQIVFGPQNYTCAAGWNTHPFSTAWEWDGVSNVIVEICYDWVGPSTYTYNAINNLTATPYNSYLVFYSDGIPSCPELFSYQVAAQRPNTRFGNCTSIALPSDYTYNWNPTTGVSGTPPTVTLAPQVTTTYTVSITSNFGGCVKQDTVPITVINPFTLTMPASVTYCPTAAIDTLTATTLPAVTNGVWSGISVADLGNQADGTFNPATAGMGSFYAVFTAGASGCTVKDSTLLVVTTAPAATWTVPGPFCITDNAVNIVPTNAGGTFNGQGITNGTAGTFNPATAGAGTWPIEYVLGGTCPDSLTQNIVVNAQPVLGISSDINSGCGPLNINFASTAMPVPANGTAQWFFGDGTTGNQMIMTHTYADTGFFNVTYIYTDLNGCSDTIVYNNMIQVYPNAVAAFAANPTQTTIIDPTVYFTNMSTGAITYQWELMPDSFSTQTNPVWNYTDVGTYTVTLIAYNQYGCNDTTTQVVVIDPDVALYVPNAFTPGDGNNLNDNFMPYVSGIDNSTFKMEIYDRWGEKIFTSTDPSVGWNGKKNGVGDLVQIDAYVWKIYFKDTKNKKYTKVGHVTVVK